MKALRLLPWLTTVALIIVVISYSDSPEPSDYKQKLESTEALLNASRERERAYLDQITALKIERDSLNLVADSLANRQKLIVAKYEQSIEKISTYNADSLVGYFDRYFTTDSIDN